MKYAVRFLFALLVMVSFSILTEYLAYYQPIRAALPASTGFLERIDVLRVGLQAICLMFGILAGQAFEHFRTIELAHGGRITLGLEFRNMLSSPQFYVALAASPIVFTVVLSATRGAPLFLSTVFALQNGFFWKTVLPTAPTPLQPR